MVKWRWCRRCCGVGGGSDGRVTQGGDGREEQA